MTARGRLLSGLVAMVIAVAGFVTVGAPTAAAVPTGTLQYVALGDSYAAGVGVPPYRDTICFQSINSGYPALLDPKGRIDLLDNATCAGAKTSDVASYVADPMRSELNGDTRLVTLTVGGNDLGFAGLARTCTTPEMQLQCLAAIKDAVAVDRLLDLGGHLTDLYNDVAEAAPNALIVVTGYPYLLESDPNNPISTAFNAATAALNTTIKDAVNATHNDNIVYVDVTKPFEGHGIGSSDDPFINAPTPGEFHVEDFHPNAAGYRAYAKAISAAIRAALDRQEQLA
jgi:lysophospholipase L1-like esterase